MKKKNITPIVEEPIAGYADGSQLNAQIIWQLFKETDQQIKKTGLQLTEQLKETREQLKETREQLKEMGQQFREQIKERDLLHKEQEKKQEKSAREWEEIKKELGGIGKSNGEIAEDYFYSAIEHSMTIANMKFDTINRNNHAKKNKLEAEYDIILSNNKEVVVVEIKYNFKSDQLDSFYKEKLKRFKSLFPYFQYHKLYGAVAGMTFAKNVKKAAEEYGFFILSQHNESYRLDNSQGFEANEIK
jgi:hypothetical protein